MRRRHLLALMLFAASAARAGDIADMRPYGFSADGRYFAYEQFGEQDGTGFPYAEFIVLDTLTNRQVEGSPVDVLVRRERTTIGEARQESLSLAAPLAEKYDLGADPGHLVAYNPVSELSDETTRLRYQLIPSLYRGTDIFELSLEQFALPAEGACGRHLTKVQGFRLFLASGTEASEARLVSQDASQTASGLCPVQYALGAVVTARTGSSAPHIAMLQMLTPGFEGFNLRWLAVAVKP